jgi:hypothetical protein
MGEKWQPENIEGEVKVETKPVFANYPEVGTPAIARLGGTVIYGTFQQLHTGTTDFICFRTDGTNTHDLLWIRDGWEFELRDAEAEHEDAVDAAVAAHEESLQDEDEKEFF